MGRDVHLISHTVALSASVMHGCVSVCPPEAAGEVKHGYVIIVIATVDGKRDCD